jgi:hypothetical protein
LKDTLKAVTSDTADDTVEKQAGPQGIGMAVAIDWGLAVQMLATPLIPLVAGSSGNFKQFTPLVVALFTSLFCIPAAALCFVFGEGVRRGWHWTRIPHVVFNALLFLGGFFTLHGMWQNIKQGSYWSIEATFIMLIISPLIAWRLSRPRTAAWFATVTSSEARKRHGGRWPAFIAAFALVGGIVQALASFFR